MLVSLSVAAHMGIAAAAFEAFSSAAKKIMGVLGEVTGVLARGVSGWF